MVAVLIALALFIVGGILSEAKDPNGAYCPPRYGADAASVYECTAEQQQFTPYSRR
jgi:hypothetical protein